MELSNLRLESACYVVLRLPQGPAHAITKHRHDLLWYPETAMGLIQQMTYQPFVQSIVTENPWLIACYDREDVYIWDKEGRKKARWVHPFAQTYGADVSGIYSNVFGLHSEMPAMIRDGGRNMKKIIAAETKKRA